MWPLLGDSAGSEVSLKNKITYLSLVSDVHNCQLDDEKEIKLIRELIDEKLLSVSTRIEGLLYLEAAMRKCSSNFSAGNWGAIVLATLKTDDTYVGKEIACKILTHVIRGTCSLPSRTPDSFAYYIPLILPHLLSMDTSNKELMCAVKCLSLCMKNLPKLVEPLEHEILEFLIKHADSLSTEVIEVVAECYAALPALLFFKEKNKTFIQTWLSYYLKALNTIQNILTSMHFQEVDPLEPLETTDILKIPYDAEDGFSSILYKARILSFLCRCLVKLISIEDSKLKLPIHETLRFVDRLFNLKNIERSEEPNQSDKVMLFAFSVMQTSALTVLEGLILRCNLTEQSANILHLIRKSIEAAIVKNFPRHSSKSLLRCTSWKVLNAWLYKFGAKGGFNPATQYFLVAELLNDISVDKDCQTEGVTHRLNASRYLTDENIASDPHRADACNEALQALEKIISIASPFLNSKLSEDILTIISRVVKRVQMGAHSSEKLLSPYDNDNCRRNLYEVVLAITLSSPFNMKWLTKAIGIFRFARKDPNVEVSYYCQRSINTCRLLIHQKKPCPEMYSLNKTFKDPPVEEEAKPVSLEDCGWDDEPLIVPPKMHMSHHHEETSNELSDMPPAMGSQHNYQHPTENAMQGGDFQPVKEYSSPPCYSEQTDSQCNGSQDIVMQELVSVQPTQEHIEDEDSEEEEEECLYEEEVVGNIPMKTGLTQQPTLIAIQEVRTVEDEEIDENSAPNDENGELEMVEEEEELEEEEEASTYQQMQENGVNSSEEDESIMEEGDSEEGEEQDEKEEEEEVVVGEEEEEGEVVQELSESFGERPLKKQKLNHEEVVEEEHSKQEKEEARSDSPTVDEMLADACFDPPPKENSA